MHEAAGGRQPAVAKPLCIRDLVIVVFACSTSFNVDRSYVPGRYSQKDQGKDAYASMCNRLQVDIAFVVVGPIVVLMLRLIHLHRDGSSINFSNTWHSLPFHEFYILYVFIEN